MQLAASGCAACFDLEAPVALNFVALALATGFGVAYLTPVAKATLASAVTVAVYAAIHYAAQGEIGEVALGVWSGIALALAIVAAFFVGVWASSRVKSDADPDPSKVVIDEVAGQLVALVLLAPAGVWNSVAAFVLFRLFDVWKPLGIRRLEAIPGGWGIMLDDVAAGVLAAVVNGLAMLVVGLVW